MRLRRTALPSAFLMLQPNRLFSRPLGRRNTVNSRLVRRRPSRYTASYSLRRTNRASRGKSSRGGSDAREAVASLLAASCKDFPSTLSFHAFAKSVLLMSAPHMRLKSPFRQRYFSVFLMLSSRAQRGTSVRANSSRSCQEIWSTRESPYECGGLPPPSRAEQLSR
jgi:hypothetical protein